MIALLLLSAVLSAGSEAVTGPPVTGAVTESAAKSVSGSAATGQASAPAGKVSDLVEITLERKKNYKIESMATGHVFDKGDVIRMRLSSHYVGYLYVMNQGTSGRFTTVFPAADTGSDNRVMPDRQYLVPAVDEGWFEIEGPAGFDVLYFLLSPTPLATPSAAAFANPAPASSMKPRCNDQIFRARGECMDDSAGPAALPLDAPLPAPLAPLAHEASRDIIFTKEKGGSTVAVAGPGAAPMLYTFRLAHQ